MPVSTAPRVAVAFEGYLVRASVPMKQLRLALRRAKLGRITPLKGSPSAVVVQPARSRKVGRAWSEARALEKRLAAISAYVEPLFDLEVSPSKSAAAKSAKSAESAAPSDPQWSLGRIGAFSAWALPPPQGGRRMGEGIVVGHPDTGFTKHPEIWDPAAQRLQPERGKNFVEGGPPVDPLEGQAPGHGTSTASVIMSASNAAGVVGVAPAASLVPYRVSSSVVHFSFRNVLEAVRAAVTDARVDVISMSLGGPFPSRGLEEELERAYGAGVILLAAAGNVWPWVTYPARYSTVVAVAATNVRDEPWRLSASGSTVDVAAPGQDVWRAAARRGPSGPKFTTAPSSGTSYAVAATAGAAALWIAFHGGRARLAARLGGAERIPIVFRQLLTASVRTPSGWDTGRYGAGIIDCRALLAAPLPAAPKTKTGAKAADAKKKAKIDVASRDALAEDMLGARGARRVRRLVDARPELAEELMFQLATDPAVRDRITQPAAKSAGVSKGKKTEKRASESMSRQLARHLESTS